MNSKEQFYQLAQRLKAGNLIVHTPKEEDANLLIEVCDEYLPHLVKGIIAPGRTWWSQYKDETCYRFSNERLKYGSLPHYQQNADYYAGYDIVEYVDLLDQYVACEDINTESGKEVAADILMAIGRRLVP